VGPEGAEDLSACQRLSPLFCSLFGGCSGFWQSDPPPSPGYPSLDRSASSLDIFLPLRGSAAGRDSLVACWGAPSVFSFLARCPGKGPTPKLSLLFSFLPPRGCSASLLNSSPCLRLWPWADVGAAGLFCGGAEGRPQSCASWLVAAFQGLPPR